MAYGRKRSDDICDRHRPERRVARKFPRALIRCFTLPTADKWTLIISKKTGEPGIPYPEGEDLLRVDMKVSQTQSPWRTFTIAYHQEGRRLHPQL